VKYGVRRGQYVGSLVVHPQAVHFGEELVTDAAVDGPILFQALVVSKNFST